MVRAAPAVQHAARIVDFVAAHPRVEFTLSEIARGVELNKTSCLSILLALVGSGAVIKHPGTGRYSLGPLHIRLGMAASHRFEFVDMARAELDRLCEPDEYWTIGTISGMEMIVLATSESKSRSFKSGDRIALSPPLGAIYVAWSPPDVVDAWVRQAVHEDEPLRQIALRNTLATTKQRGFSVGLQSLKQTLLIESLSEMVRHPDRDALVQMIDRIFQVVSVEDFLLSEIEPEQTYSVSFVSAPVLDDDDALVAVLTVGGSRVLSGKELDERGRALVQCAWAIAPSFPSGRRSASSA